MKANSIEELVTNSNIAGELRNNTDWHDRLVKFAQMVADWQKEQMMKEAVKGEYLLDHGQLCICVGRLKGLKPCDKDVKLIILPKEEKE